MRGDPTGPFGFFRGRGPKCHRLLARIAGESWRSCFSSSSRLSRRWKFASQSLPVALEPCGRGGERLRLEPARPPLGVAAARDQPGALEDLEMLGDRRLAHGEGLGELGHRRFARAPAAQGSPAGSDRRARRRWHRVDRRQCMHNHEVLKPDGYGQGRCGRQVGRNSPARGVLRRYPHRLPVRLSAEYAFGYSALRGAAGAGERQEGVGDLGGGNEIEAVEVAEGAGALESRGGRRGSAR